MRSRLLAVGPESPASEGSEVPTPGPESFALRPRARLGLPLGYLGVFAGLLSIQIGVGLGPLSALIVAGLGLLPIAAALWLARRRSRRVTCSSDELVIVGFWRTRRVPVAKVHAVYRRWRSLVVWQRGRVSAIVLAPRHFVAAQAVDRLEALLLTALARSSGDLAALARRRAVARSELCAPYLTGCMALGLVAVFALEVAHEAMSSARGLIEQGALVPLLVARGEVWRVLSGMLLHANASHLASNLFSLLSFGMLLERRFGRWRVAAICLASWVLGGIFAAFSPILTIVGASGIAFGLMGAWLSQLLGMRDLPSSRLSLGASAAILMYQLALGIFAPGISFLTHLGGFLAGTALGLWYVQRIDLANAAPSQSRPLRSGVAVCATLLVALASYGLTRRSGLDFAAELRRELAQGPAHEDTARLDRAMLWASLIAQDPGAAAADLELARTPLEQGAARYTYGSPALDVLAMLRFRTGDHEGAVAAQLESVARRVRRSSLRELLRGDADALFARLGVYLAAAPRAPHGGNPLDSIRFNRTHDGRALDLELSEPEPRGSILYLIAYEKERPSGILGMRFTSASGSVRMTLPLLVPTSARLELVYTAQARVLPPRNESRYVLLRGDAVSFLAPPPG